jgi:hypothetical protein
VAAAIDGGAANGIVPIVPLVVVVPVKAVDADEVKGHDRSSIAEAGGDWRVGRRRCSHKPVLCFSWAYMYTGGYKRG